MKYFFSPFGFEFGCTLKELTQIDAVLYSMNGSHSVHTVFVILCLNKHVHLVKIINIMRFECLLVLIFEEVALDLTG